MFMSVNRSQPVDDRSFRIRRYQEAGLIVTTLLSKSVKIWLLRTQALPD
jgi:hypothetical protein